MKSTRHNPLVLSAMAAALLLAFAPAVSQADEITQLTKPYTTIDVGAGYVSKDNQRFGQYTGLTDKGGYGIVDFSLIKRDDATGTWFKLKGTDLGYDDRELRLEQERQGDWGYFVDYSRIPRYDPFTVTTGLAGIGTTNQVVNGVPFSEHHLQTVRDRWTLGFQKAFYDWDVHVRYRNEQKDGARLFGQGYFGAHPRFLTDPIDQTTQLIDVYANYTTERYQLRVGYFGSMFDNHNKTLQATPGDGTATHYFLYTSLPPDNQAHQFYAEGGYNFSRTMRGTFKVSYARATQNDGWPMLDPAVTPAPNLVQGGLDGRVDTTFVQAGLSGRATPKFSWLADFRYRKHDDKTPEVQYWPTLTPDHYVPRSLETTTGKVVGHYALPMGFRLTGDLTWQQKKRSLPEEAVVNLREKVNETTARVEVRRAVSETVTGALALLHSKRDGSDWLDSLVPDGNLIAPIYMADRDRDTVRLSVNWMPSDPLSLNFRTDLSRDSYKSRDILGYNLGPREGKGINYSVDAAYTFNQKVSGSAWYSHNENRLEQATCSESNVVANTCFTTAPIFAADLRNIADSFGLGLKAGLSSKIDVGANVTDAKVRDEFNLTILRDSATPNTATPLDDIHTKVTTLNVYGKYALDRQSGIRVDYIYDRYQTDDWTWANWVYTDGTTVLQNPDQKVNFLGVSYFYRFQ